MRKRSRISKIITIFTTLLLLLIPIYAQAEIGLTLTNNFFVNDYANIITDNTEAEIVELGQSLYDKTGAELVLVTVEGLNGYDIEDFTYNLFNEWELGDAKANNGVLILFAPNEVLDDGLIGDYSYSIGAGVEDILSAGELQSLCNEYLEQYFLDEDYSGGAISIYEAIGAHLEYNLPVLDSYTDTQQQDQNTGNGSNNSQQDKSPWSQLFYSLGELLYTLIKIAFIFVIILLLWNWRRRVRYNAVYGVPFYPYSRRYIRRFGPEGYWGPHGRPFNPPPPHSHRGWHSGPGPRGPQGPGSRPGGPGASGSGSRPGGGFGSMGNRPTSGGGGMTRGTGGSRSGSGASASAPSAGRPTVGSGSSSSGSRPASGGGGMSRGTGGSRSSSGSRVSTPSAGRPSMGSRSGGAHRPSGGGGMSRGSGGSRSGSRPSGGGGKRR